MADASVEHVAKAKQLIGERRYQDAVRALRRALVSRPDDLDARLLLGQVLLALERWDETRAEMMALARRAPTLAGAHRLLGEAYLRSGKPDKAAEALKKCLSIDPNDDAARELLAETGEEAPPRSETLDRWFDPDALGTVQTTPPDFVEEATGAAIALPSEPTALSAAPTSVTKPAPLGSPIVVPKPGELRKPKATIIGMPSPLATSPRTPKATLVGVPPPNAASAGAPAPPGRAPKATLMGVAPVRAPARPSPFDDDDTTNVAEKLTDTSAPTTPQPAAQSSALRDAARARTGSIPPPPPGSKSMPPPPPPSSAGGAHAPKSLPPPPPMPSSAGSAHAPKSVMPPPPKTPSSAGSAQTPSSAGSAQAPSSAGSARSPKSVMPPPAPGLSVTSGAVTTPRVAALPTPAQAREETMPLDLADIDGAPQRMSDPTVPLDLSDPAIAIPPRPPVPHAPPPQAPPPAPPPQAQPSPRLAAPVMPDFAPPDADAARALAAPDLDAEVITQEHSAPTVRTPKPGTPVIAVAAAGAVLVVLLASGLGVRACVKHRHAAAIAAAVAASELDGRPASLDAALTTIANEGAGGAPETLALIARLQAAAALEQGRDGAEADRAVAALEGDAAALPDAHIARTYRALARMDLATATREAAQIPADPAALDAAEGAHARAVSLAASGDVGRALAEARSADRLRASAGTRGPVLVAALTARSGDVDGALTLLDHVPAADASPDVRAMRARLLSLRALPGDAQRARTEATAVLGPLATQATPNEKAWAHLAQAIAARAQADASTALAEAHAATPPPPGDADFVVTRAGVLADAGAPAEALQVLGGLPAGVGDATRRALIAGRAAIATGDLPTADAALAAAGTSAEADLLRGRLAEAHGDRTNADRFYAQVPDAAPEMVAARTRRAALALAAGRARDAATLLAPAIARTPTDAEAATVAARARLALHDVRGAQDALAPALAVAPGAPALLAARAEVELARGDPGAAAATLQAAIAQSPRDPVLRLALADTLRRAGRPDDARAAYQALLLLTPEAPRALLGLADLAIDAGDVMTANGFLDRAERTGQAATDVAARRPLIGVVQGAGATAIAALEPLARAGHDPKLWDALGRLALQAEKGDLAHEAFAAALGIDALDAEAQLGDAQADLLDGNTRGAASSLTRAARTATERGLPPSFLARIDATRGRLRFEAGQLSDAADLARSAVEKDPKCAEAHLLLAMVAIERHDDPVPEMRLASTSNAPPAEAIGRLAVRLESGAEACALASRYLAMAPGGYDAEEVRKVADRCH